MNIPKALKVAIPVGTLVAAGLTLGLAASATAAGTTVATTSYRSPQCVTSQLRGSIVDDGGGAAGSVEVAIKFKNVGAHSCTLQGWPGVSFVGHGNGTQLGAAAQQNRGSLHPTVTIGAGKTAIAPLRVVQALNFPISTCEPAVADGFRVYPPGERNALFIKQAGYTACVKKQDVILTISAVRPTH